MLIWRRKKDLFCNFWKYRRDAFSGKAKCYLPIVKNSETILYSFSLMNNSFKWTQKHPKQFELSTYFLDQEIFNLKIHILSVLVYLLMIYINQQTHKLWWRVTGQLIILNSYSIFQAGLYLNIIWSITQLFLLILKFKGTQMRWAQFKHTFHFVLLNF